MQIHAILAMEAGKLEGVTDRIILTQKMLFKVNNPGIPYTTMSLWVFSLLVYELLVISLLVQFMSFSSDV